MDCDFAEEDEMFEKDNKEERERILGFLPQREIVYNKLLPYASEIDGESNQALALIKKNLSKAVLSKELRPSVFHWTRQLIRYIRVYGLKFSKEDHILFIKLYLELIFIPDVEAALVEQLLPILIKLLKKRELLSREDLVLEWRPLYRLMERMMFSKHELSGLEWFPTSIENNLKQVLKHCSVYFPPSATQEILDEFRPYLCPFDITMGKALIFLEIFLPTMALTEEERSCSWKIWFEEFFTVWESIHTGPDYEGLLTLLFARLALHNVGYIDWGPHCAKILTRLLRTCKLPVGKLNHKAKVSVPLHQDASARWIVAMMGGPSSELVLNHIENMFKAIKSYYYPSNFGKWTPSLLSFLQSLSYKFVYRIHKERYKKESWELKTPDSYKITDAEISRFVEILKPVAFLALYSKMGTNQACRVFQLLATLRPELVLPELLEKSYVALETLTEPHQLKGCLSALSSTLRSLMRYSKWYKEGRSHVIPILFRTLPAIDSNDFPKSVLGFHFISMCFSLMPIVDCSGMIQDHPDLDEVTRNLCIATAELPDFVILYLDRIFSVIESLNEEHSTQTVESGSDPALKLNMQEAVIISGITSTVAIIMVQSSDEIYMRCLNKIFQFVTSHLLSGSSAHSAVMNICAAAIKANPELAVKKFVPHFCNDIKEMFEENPHITEEEKADQHLLWDLVVLTGTLKYSSHYALEYKEDIFNVLRLSLKVQSKRIYQQACKLMQEFLFNLTSYYETELGSVDPGKKKEKSYMPIYDWGKCVAPWEVNMSWHEPSEHELRTGFEIIENFLLPELEELKNFTEKKKELTKDELLRCLSIIYCVTVGSSQILPEGVEKDVEIKDRNIQTELLSWKIGTITSSPQYKKVLEELGGKLSGLKNRIFETTRNALWFIMETREDDVKSISKIIAIYSECLQFHELYKTDFEKHWSSFTNGKRAMQDTLRGRKRHQRLLVIDRALLQHQLRSLAYNRTRYTELKHNAMIDLLKLSISHYSQVRIAAQRVFYRGIQLSPYKAEQYYLPLLLESLKKDPVQFHKEVKGALYVIHGPGGRNSAYLGYLHKWDVIAQSWPAIVGAIKSDRPSVVKLYDKLGIKIQTTYNTIAIDVELNEASLQAAKCLLKSTSQPVAGEIVLTNVDERLQEQNANNLILYQKLVSDMMDLIDTGDLSWRQMQFASGCLSFMIRWDVPLHPRLARHFTQGLIDDTLHFRQMCANAMSSIVKKQERKRKVIMRTPGEISGIPVKTGSSLPGNRHDNKWLQYDSSRSLKTAEEYDSAVFIEKTHWGYYQWPEKLKTYDLNDTSRKLDRTRDEMSDDEKEVFDCFSSPEFVKQLLKYYSLENVKGKDKYDGKRMEMFKGLFRNFGDSVLPIFQSEVEELVKDSHESNQRCVAEVVAGLVVGTKHWNFEKVNSLWDWLIPILRKTIDNISVETLKDWDVAYGHITQNRDPNKFQRLFEFLIKDPVSGKGGSFMDSSRLYLIQGGIHQQEWRVAEILHRLLEHIEPKLDHQYKNVRDKMGSVLASIFLYDISLIGRHDMSSPARDAFIDRVLPRLAPLAKEDTPHIAAKSSEPDIKPTSSHRQVPADYSMFDVPVDVVLSQAAASEVDEAMDVDENMISQLQQGLRNMLSSETFAGQDRESILKQFMQHQQQLLPPGVSTEMIQDMAFGRRSQLPKENSDIRVDIESTSDDSSLVVDEERNSAVRLLKTLMKWIISAQRGCLQPTIPSVLKLLPLICKMSPVDTQGSDEELHHDTQVSLSCLAQSYLPPAQLKHVVDTIKEISESSSWHARHTILKFSQIFIFNNIFTLQEQQDCVNDLRDLVLQLISDEQLEVREMATSTLGGLLQCNFLKIDEKLKHFMDENCKIRVKRSKKVKMEDTSSASYQKKLRSRHAGVLALSACILSSPYSIPEYLPGFLMKLSDHLHDPQPIESTVKKTFSEFRRTHHDSWHLDKLKFTSDQLSILTDLLVSPCYYA